MAFGYPATPQAIGQALVQYQPVSLRAPQIAQPNASGQITKAFNDALGGWADRPRQPTIPDVGVGQLGNAWSQAAAQNAVNRYGPVIMDPNNPYAGSQWDPNYGR
jgi:hypothetical protein